MPSTTRRDFLKRSAAATAGATVWATAEAVSGQEAAGSAGVPSRRINHDLHTHTLYSDGAHPIPLHILKAARSNSTRWPSPTISCPAARSTTHRPSSIVTSTRFSSNARPARLDRAQRGRGDRVGQTGRISLDARNAARVEWILCDLGGLSEGTLRKTPQDKQQYIENVIRTYMGLCDVPYLNAIAHPLNTGNTQPAALPEDYPEHLLRELAAKMAEKGKVFDVMNDMIYWFHRTDIAPRELTAQYVELVKLFVAAGVRFQISSDDHRTGLGNTRWSEIVVARAAVPAAQIVDPAKIRLIEG